MTANKVYFNYKITVPGEDGPQVVWTVLEGEYVGCDKNFAHIKITSDDTFLLKSDSLYVFHPDYKEQFLVLHVDPVILELDNFQALPIFQNELANIQSLVGNILKDCAVTLDEKCPSINFGGIATIFPITRVQPRIGKVGGPVFGFIVGEIFYEPQTRDEPETSDVEDIQEYSNLTEAIAKAVSVYAERVARDCYDAIAEQEQHELVEVMACDDPHPPRECQHGNVPDECEPCMVQSDFAYDAMRKKR